MGAPGARNWEEGRRIRDLDDPTSEDDPRLVAAGSMVERIADHAGEDAASTTVAGQLHRLLYDSLDDLETVDRLRDAGAGTGRSTALQARAEGLQRQVEERMDHALGTITDIFEAVLAHDAVALRRVLARAQDELRQLRAVEEVETLLSPTDGDPGPATR
jgi:predicted hydrolase (HD superfamily)